MLGLDFELQFVSVLDIRMVGKEGGKLGVVTRFQEAVRDDNRKLLYLYVMITINAIAATI